MSLRVWLPLTKDLRNQGLDNVTVTNNGATFNSAGKLGGCYTFDGTNDRIQISNLPNPKNISVAFWMKRNADTGTRQFMFTAWSGVTCELQANNSFHCGVYNNGSTVGACSYTSEKITVSSGWVHVVYTFEDKVGGKLYLNGSLISTASYSGSIQWGTTTGNIGYYATYFNGAINDFRIYDHCLSPMEVKELSKGLVLHYLLNRGGWGQENIIPGTNLGTTNWYWTMQAGNYTVAEETTLSGVRGCKFTRGTTAQSGWSVIYYNNINESLFKASTKYKLSVDIYPSVNTNFVVSIRESNGTNVFASAAPAKAVAANKWNHLEYDLTTVATLPSSTGETIYFQSMDSSTGVSYIFRNLKLEEGEVATPWCPNSSDVLATTIGLNGTTEYDCSGYCNNGEKIGALTYTSDTPKYQVSTHIGATSQKIHISGLTTSGFGDSYSFAWWGKRTSNNPMFWGFSDGIRLNGMYIGTLWNTGDGSNNPLYKIGTTTQVAAPSVNVWHHYVMTGNGTKCYVYLDGELWAEAKTYKAINGTSIYINGWNSATDYCSDNTDISDFRIYATALSAEEIQELYNMGRS